MTRYVSVAKSTWPNSTMTYNFNSQEWANLVAELEQRAELESDVALELLLIRLASLENEVDILKSTLIALLTNGTTDSK